MPAWICANCAGQYANTTDPPLTCAICADEREYIPRSGQRWTTLDQLVSAGHRVKVDEVEPSLYGVSVQPKVGIGQRALLVRTPRGNLLWDATGSLDPDGFERVHKLGGLAAIAASHPHLYGVQIEWSHAFGGVPVFLPEADRRWLMRPDPVTTFWTDTAEVLPGVTLIQTGGHFPGSAVALSPAGADGRGVLLTGDTLMTSPDGRWVSFMRSYVNYIPLSAPAVQRLAATLEPYVFDRLYDSFGGVVPTNGKQAVRRSADRYTGWIRGDFDADT